VEQNHLLQLVLPAFGRRPRPGDTLHISALVAGVAASALGDDQWIGDRDPFFAFDRGSRLPAVLGCEESTEDKASGQAANQPAARRKCTPSEYRCHYFSTAAQSFRMS
jgi:hypothetical protein